MVVCRLIKTTEIKIFFFFLIYYLGEHWGQVVRTCFCVQGHDFNFTSK